MKVCQECGAKAENDDIYCPDCGTKIKDEKETKKITVLGLIKIIAIILLLIFNVAIFSSNPPLGIIIFIFFMIWANIINRIIKKFFNAEISLGVKIILTVLLIILVVFSISNVKVSQTPKVIERYDDENYAGQFVKDLERIVNSKDYNGLDDLRNQNKISEHIFNEFLTLINSDSRDISFDFVRTDTNSQDVVVMIRLYNDFGYYVEEKTKWDYEKSVYFEGEAQPKFVLVNIQPGLADLNSRTFEGETASKLAQINKPIIAVRQADIRTG
ncbi:MAG: zinc ribbon domain-containing protein [Nanoarchaeota archaeon]|nr:zinc ribbon domain-containing protein [Nanoarchaeota archaeon]